jgi:hypothetical protein
MATNDLMEEAGTKPMARNKAEYHKSQRPVTSSTPAVIPIVPDAIDTAQTIVVDYTKTPDGKDLKTHRQCPICWGQSKGFGTAYSTSSSGKTYYKCDQSLTENSPCGHTWSVSVMATKIVIETRVIKADGETG